MTDFGDYSRGYEKNRPHWGDRHTFIILNIKDDGIYGTITFVLLVAFLYFFELLLEGIDGQVDGFLEGVGYLAGKQVVALRHEELDSGLLILGSFGFYNFQIYFNERDFFMMLNELFGLLVDELLQLFRCIEVNGFNLNVHIILLF